VFAPCNYSLVQRKKFGTLTCLAILSDSFKFLQIKSTNFFAVTAKYARVFAFASHFFSDREKSFVKLTSSLQCYQTHFVSLSSLQNKLECLLLATNPQWQREKVL
jgi:hypothetical protein